MLFIGHTRFSLYNPESVAWVASNGSKFSTNEEYIEYLFSEARLKPRFEIFVGESLPQLALASKNFDYYHVVSYSEHLPKSFEDILIEASDTYPFLILDKHIDGKSSVNPHGLARSLYFGGSRTDDVGEAFGLFRLDDDDLISVDFFRQVSAYVTKANVGMLVSLGRGVTAVYDDGLYYAARESFRPLIAIGLLSVCSFESDGTLNLPVEVSHHLSDRSNAVIIDSRRIGYLWSRHITQDTALSYKDQGETDPRKRVLADISHLPKVSWQTDLSASFPFLGSRILRHEEPTLNHWCLFTGASQVKDDPLVFETPLVVSGLYVDVLLKCGIGVTPGNALLSFQLVNSEGCLLSEHEMNEVLSLGLVKSPNQQIGFYQYLNIHPGENSLSVSVSLPATVRCKSISIRRWRDPSVDILLQRMDFYGRSEI